MEFNLEKYEKLNSLPDASTEYNNQVIAILLKQKASADSPKPKVSAIKPKEEVVAVMNAIDYEKSIIAFQRLICSLLQTL